MKRSLVLAALSLLTCCALPAAAQTCSLSYTALHFGTYTGTLLTGTNSSTVTCTTAFTIGLNAGTGIGATTTIRKMTGPGGATLNYQIFQNSSRTINWGNTTGVDIYSGTGSLVPQVINIYSEVTAGQVVAAGSYTDTISSATASFTVTATVAPSCTVSASALSFGNYSGLLIDASSAVTVNCTNLTAFNIGLNAGTATGATVSARKMTSPASATLSYKLFRDSGRTQNWGNTVGTDTLSTVANGTAVQYAVFGRLPAGQSVNPAVYSDTIIATVTY
jgi:spore coat protein U-like protein